jgi:hypothetical protein
MSKPVYKAIVHTTFPDDLIKMVNISKGLPRNYAPSTSFIDLAIDSEASRQRVEALIGGKVLLADKADHLLNVYVDCDRATYSVTITYVFNDKNTALMFKLSH